MSIQPNITLAMIKSDAFTNNVDTQILDMIRAAGFAIIDSHDRQTQISDTRIDLFYEEHLKRSYYQDLFQSVHRFVMPMILEYQGREKAYAVFRGLIGATSARNALPETIRGKFGGHRFDPDAPLAANAIHGSDSLASVVREIGILFPSLTKLRLLQHGEFYLSDINVTPVEKPTWIVFRKRGVVGHLQHPESSDTDPDEIFLINTTEERFNASSLESKRLGRIAYDTSEWRPLIGFRPMFVKASELQAKEIDIVPSDLVVV